MKRDSGSMSRFGDSAEPRRMRRRSVFGIAWLLACLLGAWACWPAERSVAYTSPGSATEQGGSSSLPTVDYSTQQEAASAWEPSRIATTSNAQSARRTKRIEEVRLGDRVAAFNPELTDAEHSAA